MHISYTDEFEKDLKKLQKKYQSITQDFEILKTVIIANPTGKDASKHWNEISGISGKDEGMKFFKVRLMCRSVRGSDFRVTYLYNGESIELLFIEMYFKGDKTLEDRSRLYDIVKNMQKKNEKM